MVQNKKKKAIGLVAVGLSLALAALTGCSSSSSSGSSASAGSTASKGPVTITNVSYDPTREFYVAYDKAFQDYWKKKTGQDVTITQSHGGSGAQANSVIQGNQADVVTLAVASDITAIQNAGLIKSGWQSKFAGDSSPYTSTIVFLVRKGNPKNIQDWGDLAKSGVGVITPNPKTSGGARWNFLASWAWAEKEYNNNDAQVKDYIKKLYANVLDLDSGSRGATTTFVNNKQGDVLIAWENEAYLAMKEYPGQYEIITPSLSILAEPPVAVVDSVVDKRGTRQVATAYLQYLYSDQGQRLAGQNFYRPSNPTIAKEFSSQFKTLNMVRITDKQFGGWDKAQKKFFADGGIFDQLYTPKSK